MRIFNVIIFLFLLLTSSQLIAQPSFPEKGELYISTTVPRIDIRIHPDTLKWIYDNPYSDREFRALFVFNNGNVKDSVDNVGFRLRGNTSRSSQKKSFKISFNTFVKGREYQGVEKMNLNGEHNDPSVSRARIYWEILRRSEIAGPRSNHARLYINGKFYGVYMNVEHIDEEFTKAYFGSENGNLYKCLYGSDLTVKSVPDLKRIYELKTNTDINDYTDLANFISILNNTPLAELPCELEKVFNVQDYLKIAAIDIITGNWDGYIYNNNNFYLYNNPKTGLFEYIPYDVDNTFGIDWWNIDWSIRNIYNWTPSSPRPLFTRLLQVPEYRAQYTYYIKQVINSITAQQHFIDYIYSIRDQISQYVDYDPYYRLDYGYTFQSFNGSWTAAAGNHVRSGIIPFIQNRNSSALSQVGSFPVPPIIKYIDHNSPMAQERMIVKAHVEGVSISTVHLSYKLNNGNWLRLPMNDKGESGDMIAGDKIYTASIQGMNDLDQVEIQVNAVDINQLNATKPCISLKYTVPVTDAKRVLINELMSSNKSIIADEKGEYDDWVELYNPADQSVWLGDKYLSDNFNNPVKWKLPSVRIDAGGYLLIWLDGQPEQGALHAPFKLSKDGEEIGLFDSDSKGNKKIDGVVYSPQQTDISIGRKTDGADEWVYFKTPTPGKSNNNGDLNIDEKPLFAWPNPVSKGFLYLSELSDYKIYDLTGRLLLSAIATDKIDISTLQKGISILMTKDGRTFKIIVI